MLGQLEPETIIDNRPVNRVFSTILLLESLGFLVLDLVLIVSKFLSTEPSPISPFWVIFLPAAVWVLTFCLRLKLQDKPLIQLTNKRFICNMWVYGFALDWKDLASIHEVKHGGTRTLRFGMERQATYITQEKNWFRRMRMKFHDTVWSCAFPISSRWIQGDAVAWVELVYKTFAEAKPVRGEGPPREWWFNDQTSS